MAGHKRAGGHPGKAARGPAQPLEGIRAEFVRLLAAGNYVETACAMVGVPRSSMYAWLLRGRREPDIEPWGSFAREVAAAEARAEADGVQAVRAAESADWRAAGWRLERKHAKRWGQRTQIQLTVDGELERLLDVAERVCCEACRLRLLDELGREGEGEGGGAAAPG